MGRLFLVLIVASFIIAINPTLRSMAQPYVQPALDPLYEWTARNDVKEYYRELEAMHGSGRALPTKETFTDFLLRRYSTESSTLDPWGNPYFLRVRRNAYVVGSAGRDQEPGTTDDVLSPELNTRRR